MPTGTYRGRPRRRRDLLVARGVAPRAGPRSSASSATDFPEAHLDDAARARASTPRASSARRARRSAGAAATAHDLASRTTLDTQLNVFADFRPKIPAAYKSAPFVLLGNIHPGLQLDVLEQVERPKLVAADTMNFWISGEPKALAEMLKRIDLLVINDEEARELSGHAQHRARGRGHPASAGRSSSSSSAASAARCSSTRTAPSSSPATRSRTSSTRPARATRSRGGSSATSPATTARARSTRGPPRARPRTT